MFIEDYNLMDLLHYAVFFQTYVIYSILSPNIF